MKMLITLESHCMYFDQNLLTFTFIHCLDTGVQIGAEASLSIAADGHVSK